VANSRLFIPFTRAAWSKLRANTPMTLSEAELPSLAGLYDVLSTDEIVEVYLPLSRLLHLHVNASQTLGTVTDAFLDQKPKPRVFIVGIAGSVAVGKSTTSRVLQALLARWPDHPRVEVVTTDGFLFPNKILEERGLMDRKGFPETYDARRLVQFLSELKSGKSEVLAPVYSHQRYDVLSDQTQSIKSAQIVILEGINVLQTSRPVGRVFVSDFFDFSIYVDAEPEDIERWYIDRFLAFRQSVFTDPTSYFHRFSGLSVQEAQEMARGIWKKINLVNLRENIRPTRERADLILKKGEQHRVTNIHLRRV
jgi:type I pantothenate kinase